MKNYIFQLQRTSYIYGNIERLETRNVKVLLVANPCDENEQIQLQRTSDVGKLKDWRQEMWKCFWSQIQVMKMNKSYSTMTVLTKWQTGGGIKLLSTRQPMNVRG